VSSSAHSKGILFGLPWQAVRRSRAQTDRHIAMREHHDAHATRAAHSLTDLPIGTSGFITELTGETVTRLHLMEMGLTPGTEVRVVRVAKFGGPLDIQVRGYRLSIRRDEAHAISVRSGGKE
jgi:ferrous iron transport protein A